MCKAKPGPRCSDHAAAEWRTTHSSLLTKQHEVEEARNSLAQAREYNAKTLTVESENLVVGWENYVNQKETEIDAITTKNENAMLNFYSTPSGQKMLENEIVKNEGFQKKVNDGYFDNEGEWAGVSYRENKIYEPSILLRSAIAHRKKQKEYYDQIHTGNVSSFQKLALIEHQTKQAKAEKTFMENHLSVCENETSKALAHAVNYPYDSKAIDNLRNAKRELYVTQTRLKFIALQVKDLETAAKNIPHTEIKPNIFKPSPTPINQTQQQPLTYENIKKLMEG